MRRRSEEVLDEIAFFLLGSAFARLHADDSLAAAALRAKRAHRCPFDETAIRDADDSTFVGDEVFHVDLALIWRDLSQPRRSIFVADFAKLCLDERKNARLFRENVPEIFDRLDQLLVLTDDLLSLGAGELITAKIEDLIRLVLTEC